MVTNDCSRDGRSLVQVQVNIPRYLWDAVQLRAETMRIRPESLVRMAVVMAARRDWRD